MTSDLDHYGHVCCMPTYRQDSLSYLTVMAVMATDSVF